MAGADVSDRPDMRALQSDIRQAEAEADLGRAGRVPDLALGAGYAREEFDDIVQGTLTIALPVFDHGQGTTAVAQARRFVDFHPDAHRPLEGAETQAKRVLLMEQLRRWFASRNRSDYVDVRVSESSDEVSFVIIHGQPPRNLSVITSASSRDRLSLVPDKQDTVVFDKVTGRLSINAQYAAEHDFYRAAIGKVFFGRDDHFEPHAVLDCGVLLDDPRAALSVEGLPALRAVALREVVLEAIDSPRDRLTWSANDLGDVYLEDVPDLLKRDRTVRKAKLALFPIHEGRPKVVEIAPPNKLTYDRRTYDAVVREFLFARGFLRHPQTRLSYQRALG